MKKIILFLFVGFFVYACSPEAKEAADKTGQEVTANTEEVDEPEVAVFPADSVAEDGSRSFHGFRISEEGAQPIASLATLMGGKGEIETKLEGTIEACCAKKGCWMTMPLADGSTMRVSFKDYGFFVPKDAGGKIAIIEGKAFNDTTSVADLRHYAEDAGQSKEEIEKITKPEIAVNFEATGVIIKNVDAGSGDD
jgi:hypothetical protein